MFWGASSGERVGANLTSPPGDMASAGRKLIGSERWPCAVSVGALRPGSLSSGGAQRTSARHGRCQRVALVLRDERPAFRLQLLIEMQPPPVEPLRCLVRRASSSFSNAPIEHDAHIARQPDRAERFLIYVGVVDRNDQEPWHHRASVSGDDITRRCRRKMAEGRGFEPRKGLRPGGFQVRCLAS